MNGGITSFHCSGIALVLDNVTEPHIRIATDGGPAALGLQGKVAGGWLSFAETGNPASATNREPRLNPTPSSLTR